MTYEQGRIDGLKEAVKEVQGWRSLQIKAHALGGFKYPEEALREHKNTLNLLGVIESKLRKASGEDSKEVFRDMINRKEKYE
jgi:hypothetical protein